MKREEKETMLKEVYESMHYALEKYPSYYIRRRDEVNGALPHEKEDILNEIYFDIVNSEMGEFLEHLEGMSSNEIYQPNIREAFREFKNDVLDLEVRDGMQYDLDDEFEELFSVFKNNINAKKRNASSTREVIEHCRLNRELISKSDVLISQYMNE